MSGPFTAAMFLVALLQRLPTSDPTELERYATMAQGYAIAEAELAVQWRGPRVELGAMMFTAMWFNGHGARDIHSGERLGAGGATCLTDIDPGNPLWKRFVPRLSELAGLTLEATANCFRVGGLSLVMGLNYCLKRKFRTNWREATWTSYHYGNRCWLSPHAHARARMQATLVTQANRTELREKTLAGLR
jgi:hypothetical protein